MQININNLSINLEHYMTNNHENILATKAIYLLENLPVRNGLIKVKHSILQLKVGSIPLIR